MKTFGSFAVSAVMACCWSNWVVLLPITVTAFVVVPLPTKTRRNHHHYGRQDVNGMITTAPQYHDDHNNGRAAVTTVLYSSVTTREAPPAITIVQDDDDNEQDKDEKEEAAMVSSRTIIDTTAAASQSSSNNNVNDSNNDDLQDLTLKELKDELIHLVTTLQGTDAVMLQRIQSCVNLLEQRWTPIETVDFFNLFGNAGAVWQLLFSTELRPPADPRKFRLRQLTQTCQHNDDDDNSDPSQGTWTATAVWDLVNEKEESNDATADNDDGYNPGGVLPSQQPVFDCSGTFSTVHNYRMASTSSSSSNYNQDKNAAGSCRVYLEFVPDRTKLQLARGSAVPRDVPGLVARLRRSMPAALFEAPGGSRSSSSDAAAAVAEGDGTASTTATTTAADTTYLDDTLRIVRYTTVRQQQENSTISPQAAALEGVRDIFIRQQPSPDETSENNQVSSCSDSSAAAAASPKQQQAAVQQDDDDNEDALF